MQIRDRLCEVEKEELRVIAAKIKNKFRTKLKIPGNRRGTKMVKSRKKALVLKANLLKKKLSKEQSEGGDEIKAIKDANTYDYTDVETIRYLNNGGVDAKLWDQVIDQCKVIQEVDSPQFEEIMINQVKSLLTDEKQDYKTKDTCSPYKPYESFIVHFFLFTTSKANDSKDPFGSTEFGIENYLEWACSRKFNIFATIIFKYAKRNKIDLKSLGNLNDPCNPYGLPFKMKNKKFIEMTFFINFKEELGLDLDLNISLRSALKSRWYFMIEAHLRLDFAYDKSIYQSLIRMVSSDVDLSSTVDTRNMLPIFPLLGKHCQKCEELKPQLTSVLSIGLKNGLKVINIMESTRKYVHEMRKILEFDFVPGDEIYKMCLRILQGLANKSNTDEFFALAHSVMQHMKMSKSTLDLQPYVDNESNGVSTFLVENAEKYDLKLKVPIFQQENQSKRRRRE